MWDVDEIDSLFGNLVSDFKYDGLPNKGWGGDLIIKTYNPATFTTDTRKISTSDYIKSISEFDDITDDAVAEWLDDNIPSIKQHPIKDYEKMVSDILMSQVGITDDLIRRNLYCRTTNPRNTFDVYSKVKYLEEGALMDDPLFVDDVRVVKYLGRDLYLGGQQGKTHLPPKEDIRNIEDIRLDLIEICKYKEVNEYNTLVYVGNGYWKPCEDRIWGINYRIEIMLSRGYDVYPYNLIDDRGDMLKDKSSLRRLKNIKNTLQQKRNDIECKYKKLVERIDNSETKTELYLIEREI